MVCKLPEKNQVTLPQNIFQQNIQKRIENVNNFHFACFKNKVLKNPSPTKAHISILWKKKQNLVNKGLKNSYSPFPENTGTVTIRLTDEEPLVHKAHHNFVSYRIKTFFNLCLCIRL